MAQKPVIFIQDFIKQHKAFVVYFLISVAVTIIDVLVSRVGEIFLNVVVANTIGVVTGFVIQYFLTSRHVYNSQNIRTLLIFFATFLMGLTLANFIVYLSREFLFHNSDSFWAFAVSKGFSIVIPFFFMYYLRKWWIKTPEQK